MNKGNLKSNYFFNLLYETLLIIIPFITTPYIARVLGAENLGINSFVSANTSYFVLFAILGTTSYAQREIAFYQDNEEKRSSIFSSVLVVRIAMTILTALLYLSFVHFQINYKNYYLLYLVSILCVGIDITWLFQGMEYFKITVMRNIIIKLISTVLIFVFVNDRNDLYIYMIISLGSTLFSNLYLWLFVKRIITKFYAPKELIIKSIKGSIKLFIPLIAIQVYTVLDRTMLGIMQSKSEVAYYSQPESIIKLGITVIGSLAVVLLPRMSSLVKQGAKEEMGRIYDKSISYAVLIALPATCGCYIVANDFIPIFLGTEFIPAIGVMKILSFLFIILGIARIIGTPILLPLGKENYYTLCVCTGAIVNFIANYYLIPSFGAKGAAIATVFAETCVTTLEIWFIRSFFSPKIIARALVKYLPATISMSCFIILADLLIKRALIRLIVSVIGGIAVYFLFLLIKKDVIVMETFNNLRGRLSNRS